MGAVRVAKLLCVVGLALSAYALYVEHQKSVHGDAYTAACDVNSWMSCSKVFMSQYGSILILPNSAWGVVFYLFCLLLLSQQYFSLLLLCALFASLGSLGLAYILAVKLGDFCLVCTSIYAVNFSLLWSAVLLWQRQSTKAKDA